MDITKLPVQNMAGLEYKCSCGRVHKVEISKMMIGSGVIDQIVDIIDEYKNKSILLVADKNTYAAAGERVCNTINKCCNVKKYVFSDEHLVADERTIGRLLVETESDTGLIIAVGSGTINDTTRYISCKTHIPYMIVSTAPSMDGYSSVVSPLIVDGVKTTYNAVYPVAIIADTGILKDAPENMLHAGFGDIIGKYTALCDWKLAGILNGEYYCETVVKLVDNSIEKCVNAIPGINNRSHDGMQSLIEALVLSGICIGMTGTSRPASGEEHHLSHCWEMAWMDEGQTINWLHGNNVGVGCGIILELYRYLLSIDINQVYSSKKYLKFDKDKWIKNLNDVFGKSAGRVISLKEDMVVLDENERERRMRNITDNWSTLRGLFSSAKSPDAVKDMLKQLGAPYHPQNLGINREFFIKSLIAAKDVRRRYGVLQLLEDMGILEDAAVNVANIYY